MGLVPPPAVHSTPAAAAGHDRVALIGLNPPEDVTSAEYLNTGEERSGIGLWRHDLYGVQPILAGKRAKRGWNRGLEEELLINADDLPPVVQELISWHGGESGNEWFPRMKELLWYYA